MDKQVKITTGSGAEIVIDLMPQCAPATVANFTKLVGEGFYNGLTFHRCIDGFMIQGGCPIGDGTGGPDTRIVGEFARNGHDNPLEHTIGTVSMARSGNPNSAGSQFFICVADCDFLNGQYAAFGRVTAGLNEALRIAKVPTNSSDAPLVPEVISKIELIDSEPTESV